MPAESLRGLRRHSEGGELRACRGREPGSSGAEERRGGGPGRTGGLGGSARPRGGTNMAARKMTTKGGPPPLSSAPLPPPTSGSPPEGRAGRRQHSLSTRTGRGPIIAAAQAQRPARNLLETAKARRTLRELPLHPAPPPAPQ